MVLPRAVALPKGIGRTIARRAGSSARSRSWRQTGRRGYASDHGHSQQKSSEIPWIIGSVAVTVPAAAWLLNQGPKKGGHGHDEHHEEHAEGAEEESKEEEEPQEEKSEGDEESKEEPKEEEEEGKEESKEGSKEESEEEPKEESGDEKKEDSEEPKPDSNDDEQEYEPPGPNAPKQINWTSSSKKGPGEGQKGERSPSEKKGEKDAAGDHSGAKHPYLNDPEKSKKGLGVTETAKIHGTVDPKAGARGVSQSGSSSE